MPRKIAILAVASESHEIVCAERIHEQLRSAMCGHASDVDIVSVVPDESDVGAILRSYLRFYDLDLTMYDGIISTKAPAYVARHPNHVCYLQHTIRFFYDRFDAEFPFAN